MRARFYIIADERVQRFLQAHPMRSATVSSAGSSLAPAMQRRFSDDARLWPAALTLWIRRTSHASGFQTGLARKSVAGRLTKRRCRLPMSASKTGFIF